MMERDKARLARVLALVGKGELKTSPDYLHAAMILQHGWTAEHYELAHQFAKHAADEGYVPSEGEVDPLWLAAAAKDRALISQGKPQRYGTQFKKNSKEGEWYLYEVDPTVNDDERAAWHVQPLEKARRRVEELNANKKEEGS